MAVRAGMARPKQRQLVSRARRLTNLAELTTPTLAGVNHSYGVADGDGEGEALSLFFLVSFLVVAAESVDDLLVVVAASFFWVDDFLVVDSFFMGAFDGAVVVVVDSDLVEHELMSPAASKTVME